MTAIDPKIYQSLGPIYDAATSLGRWRRALDAVASAVDAKAIALVIRHPSPETADLQMLNTTYLKFSRSPWGMYYGLRLGARQDADWDYLSRQPVHLPKRDIDMGIDVATLDQRADYSFLRKRLNVGRRVGVRLNADQVWFDAMSLGFDADVDRVPDAVLTNLQVLLPHMTKAVELGRTFTELKRRYKAVLSMLDRVKVGLAIALPGGDIVVHNEEAARILDLRDGLAMSAGRLACHKADQSAELATAIETASTTLRGEATVAEWFMALERPSGHAPLLVDVAPLSDSRRELDMDLQGALITIVDPERVPRPRFGRFATLYNLTVAETEVCELILQGFSVPEIAERRGTATSTAKNQVAAILDKTDCGRRADLIRLVIRVLPPVE